MHRARFAESLLRAARGKRREPARDPRLGRVEPERSPDGRALYARCRPEGALPQRRREGGGMIRASIFAAVLVVFLPRPALAQAPPDIDQLYKRVGSVCDLLRRETGECLREGTAMSLRLRRIAQ